MTFHRQLCKFYYIVFLLLVHLYLFIICAKEGPKKRSKPSPILFKYLFTSFFLINFVLRVNYCVGSHCLFKPDYKLLFLLLER